MKSPEAFIFFSSGLEKRQAGRQQPQQEYNSGSDSICPSRRPPSTTTTKTPPFRFAGVHNFNYPRSLSFAKGLSFNRIRCAMKSYKLSELSRAEVESLQARPRIDFSSTFGMVNPIIDAVRGRGDAAVKESVLLSFFSSFVSYGFVWLMILF
ncbi:hypothetical protein SLEP1_g50957 [Rubroshorea leprosula]|uniref:Uncharacterized protein n=1 Tax=Rubroshorea leprosula TaxID=152421 RepID=A0AAV5M2K0_9ROSI|nr:hypothetical protein SLEP1_g50957 [Rubroshorea leprosula]